MISPWCSIVIPTTYGLTDVIPPTLRLLGEALRDDEGVEVIVVRDLWGNANTARNVGIAAARGEAICVIDDDINLEVRKLLELLATVRSDKHRFYISLDPHFIVINREPLVKLGGYDERFRPCMGDDVELMLRLERAGLKKITVSQEDLKVIHLQLPRERSQRYLLNQKHLTWAYLEHRYLPVHRLVWRKNPKELLRRLKWIIEWKLVRKHQRRSIFLR